MGLGGGGGGQGGLLVAALLSLCGIWGGVGLRERRGGGSLCVAAPNRRGERRGAAGMRRGCAHLSSIHCFCFYIYLYIFRTISSPPPHPPSPHFWWGARVLLLLLWRRLADRNQTSKQKQRGSERARDASPY